MAKSRFEYVKAYEQLDRLLPDCYVVLRLDGKGFTKFTEQHGFDKPNDRAGLNLMTLSASEVMRSFPDIRMAYGQSDEYSFILHRSTTLYGRRASKLTSLVASCFTANYVLHWPECFPEKRLSAAPCFDCRAVAYPNEAVLKDYVAWRQTDAHVNNQYNTCFWALIEAGAAPEEAHRTLKGTLSDFKNELLFSRFGINYNTLPSQYRKGTVIVWETADVMAKTLPDGTPVVRSRSEPVAHHDDVIGAEFWERHPDILT